MSRKPAEPAPRGGEAFLSRWSRKKEEARQEPAEPEAPVAKSPADPGAPAPDLPPVDKLTMDSDYRAFFHPKVDEDVRRSALKKLFSDPHFNVMDRLDIYIDDYSKTEPIPPEMLAGLRQAQNIFQWAKEDREKREQEEKEMLQREASRKLDAPAAQPDAVASAPDAAPALPADPAKTAQS